MVGGLRGSIVLLSALTPFFAGNTSIAQTCGASSGNMQTALVELYTSEGCSSCPPADRFLAGIPGPAYPPGRAVAIAWHVPYWDYIGWRDRFAQAVFATRQSWLVGVNGHRTVYTPHFFVSGKEVQDWQGRLDGAIRRVNQQAAGANITFNVSETRLRVLSIDASATSDPERDQPQLFIVVTEGPMSSSVRAGENRGITLRHSHVVRALVGPLPLVQGRISARREVTLGEDWNIARIGIAAFVQKPATGEILQAVATERCELARR